MKNPFSYRMLISVMLVFAIGFGCLSIAAASAGGDRESAAPKPPAGKVGETSHTSVSIAAKTGKQSGVGRLFGRAMRASGEAAMRVSALFSTVAGGSGYWRTKLNDLSNGNGPAYLVAMAAKLVLIIALAVAMEWLLKRSTRDIRNQICNAMPSGLFQKIGQILIRLFLNTVCLGVYMFATFVLVFIFSGKDRHCMFAVSAFIVSSYYFRVFLLAATTILSPGAPGLRFFPLQDSDAQFFYRWIVRITLSATFLAAFSALSQLVLEDAGLALLFYSAAGIAVNLLLICTIWQSRKRVADIIRAAATNGGGGVSLRERLARKWHIGAMLYVGLIGAYWLIDVMVQGRGELEKLIVSIFLIPVFIGVDQWGQRLIELLYSPHEAPQGSARDAGVGRESAGAGAARRGVDMQVLLPKLKRALRVLILAFIFFTVLKLWGIDLPIGRFFTSTALSILVALILGFLAWEYAKTLIDRKIKEEMPEADEEMEEGGAGGSRKGTLLVLLRKFILSVLFVIVTLIILSSIGLEIGPLIAGAGVIGLAIGFGAQTLVKDIISGVFFLIDDAFRVGDYVETAGVKGMVEHISLRSMRLRHPRGMVHTIPFSDMGTVTNFSRDYIITKLDFRVRYDTDVETVRKIIKSKVYKPIAADEELGPKLLGKIKSQGVREMDDSAMIMRLKFKTPPGEQFVLRREVYRRMQEAFREAGIEFAHRNVTVFMPPEKGAPDPDGADAGDKRLREAGAAAAIAADAASPSKDEEKKPS